MMKRDRLGEISGGKKTFKFRLNQTIEADIFGQFVVLT